MEGQRRQRECQKQSACEGDREHGTAQDTVDDRAPDSSLSVTTTETVDERNPEPIHVVAELGEQRGEHGQRSDHRNGDDEHRRDAKGGEVLPGEQHARHRDDHGDSGDEHGTARGRCSRFERGFGAAPGGPFLALALQVEHRVVDPDREADQENHRVERLRRSEDLARDRPQAERRQDGRQREEERDSGRDQGSEDEDEDDQGDRDREEPGLLEGVHERSLELLVGTAVAELTDEELRMRRLRLVDGGEDGIDLRHRVVRVAADLEIDQGRAAVFGDLPAVLRHERRADVEHDRHLGHIRDDIVDRFLESGILGRQRLALDEHGLARGLLEAGFEDLLHPARLARAGGTRGLLRPDDERPDRERSEDEGEPAEDRDLAVVSAPAAHAAGQIGRMLAWSWRETLRLLTLAFWDAGRGSEPDLPAGGWGERGPTIVLCDKEVELGKRNSAMSYRETEHLRVLIANERKDRLALVAPIVAALGHEVIAREILVEDVGEVTARERPDVALVGLGESSDHALGLIERIVQEAACPVILLIHAPDPGFVREASKRGIFAYITDAEAKDWQSSIDIVLRRFAEYHDLEGAFGRRAVTERAKGILMERHSVGEDSAFEMLREESRTANRKLVDIASAVVDGHHLLPSIA